MRDTGNPQFLAHIRDLLDLTVTQARVFHQFSFLLGNDDNRTRLKPGLLPLFYCETYNEGVCVIRLLG